LHFNRRLYGIIFLHSRENIYDNFCRISKNNIFHFVTWFLVLISIHGENWKIENSETE
jgi:hypothetical protein